MGFPLLCSALSADAVGGNFYPLSVVLPTALAEYDSSPAHTPSVEAIGLRGFWKLNHP